jgi:hypothetical protein
MKKTFSMKIGQSFTEGVLTAMEKEDNERKK